MKRKTVMLRHLGWIIAFMAMTAHAHATSNIGCTGIGSDADVDILIGAGPVLNALEVTVGLDERVISTYSDTKFEHGNIVQFHANEHELSLDLMDDQAAELLVSVRILRYDDNENEPFQIGYLQVEGAPPVGITCGGP